jgi:membrane protease YdiL (CAAX protease family)
VIGVILSLAYERTGNLAVPMVAHGLKNLMALASIWYFG